VINLKTNTFRVKTLQQRFKFEVISGNTRAFEREIKTPEFTRPGLELVGYYEHTDLKRAVIIGRKEMSFIQTMSHEEQIKVFDFLTNELTPYILIARNLECPKSLLEVVSKKDFPVLRSAIPTSVLMNDVMFFVSQEIAPSILYHGTLMEVMGMGIILIGKSGIGKSEAALELIKRGHRLIADDSVELYKMYQRLYGRAPQHLKNLLEVRGIGIIDVAKMFGIVALSDYKIIDFAVELVSVEEINQYARVQLEIQKIEIFGELIPIIRIPVSGGRAIADLIEVGISNLKMKSHGIDATKELLQRFDEIVRNEDK
jgi:HPr kinase/phosphorylase